MEQGSRTSYVHEEEGNWRKQDERENNCSGIWSDAEPDILEKND